MRWDCRNARAGCAWTVHMHAWLGCLMTSWTHLSLRPLCRQDPHPAAPHGQLRRPQIGEACWTMATETNLIPGDWCTRPCVVKCLTVTIDVAMAATLSRHRSEACDDGGRRLRHYRDVLQLHIWSQIGAASARCTAAGDHLMAPKARARQSPRTMFHACRCPRYLAANCLTVRAHAAR